MRGPVAPGGQRRGHLAVRRRADAEMRQRSAPRLAAASLLRPVEVPVAACVPSPSWEGKIETGNAGVAVPAPGRLPPAAHRPSRRGAPQRRGWGAG